MKLVKISLIIFFSLFIFTGCASWQKYKVAADLKNPIKRVAILPLQNNTNDVEGPDYVRKKMVKAFSKYQYNVKPIKEVDILLRNQMGVTLGGQLNAVDIQKLSDLLEVEGLVFGVLMDFGEVITGVYNVRKVRAKFKLVNTISGKIFWENGLGVKYQQTSKGDIAVAIAAITAAKSVASAVKNKDKKGKDDVPWITIKNYVSNRNALENFGFAFARKLVEKVGNAFLVIETNEMIKRVTSNLPIGPGTNYEK